VGAASCFLLLSLWQMPNLRLDASSDSLLLQGDPDLAYFRESSSKYAGNEFLVLTWEPYAPLLSPDSLEPLAAMVDELERIPGVAEVTTLLDVPLLESPPLTLTDLSRADSMPTLRDAQVDRALALKELTTSPIYRNLLVSEEGDLTAVQVVLEANPEAEALLEARESLRAAAVRGDITAAERINLAEIESAYDETHVQLASKGEKMEMMVQAVAKRFRT